VAAFRRIGPLRRFLECTCFKIVGLQAAKNLSVDFFSIHSNGILESATISINLLSKTSTSFFVIDFSTHDYNQALFFVVSGFDFFMTGLLFEAFPNEDADDNVDALEFDA